MICEVFENLLEMETFFINKFNSINGGLNSCLPIRNKIKT